MEVITTIISFLTKYKYILGIAIILGLLGSIYILVKQKQKLQEDYEVSVGNVKAYSAMLDSAKNDSRVFKFKIDQLEYLNDSIINKMESVRKELKIKDKQISQMQYIEAKASKKDTITITQRDTLFTDNKLDIDTIIGDKWYKMELGLKYPNKIITNPTFNSEKYILIYTKKETINPPKKFFVCKWFQKKHTVLEVKVVEKNPYIEQKESKFIEIIP